jgi:hypothetical protein
MATIPQLITGVCPARAGGIGEAPTKTCAG